VTQFRHGKNAMCAGVPIYSDNKCTLQRIQIEMSNFNKRSCLRCSAQCPLAVFRVFLATLFVIHSAQLSCIILPWSEFMR